MNWGERRVRRLYYLAAWFFAAIATMGKGPAGFGLPVLVRSRTSRVAPERGARRALQRVVRELAQFEIVGGLLIILAVAMPWYVAMYVRHGPPFTDRLIFHDMFNRAFHHVHDTNEGDDTSFRFYVWQLGYALFPWTGLAPLGPPLVAARAARRRTTATAPTRRSCSACGSSSRSPSSRSWARSSTTTSSRPCRRSRCSSASCSTTCSAKRRSPRRGAFARRTSPACSRRRGAHGARRRAHGCRARSSATKPDGHARRPVASAIGARAPRRRRRDASSRSSWLFRPRRRARGAPRRATAPRTGRRPRTTSRMLGGAAPSRAALLLVLVGARPRRSSRRTPTSRARSGSSSSSRTTTGARGPTRSTSRRALAAFGVVAVLLVAGARGARGRAGTRSSAMCAFGVRLGASGASTSTW